MPKNDLVLEKLTEISERLVRVETRVDFISDDMKDVKAQDLIQNKLLDEHIAGVNSVKELVKVESEKRDLIQAQNDERLKKIETPYKFIQVNKAALIWVGGICSALAGIAKLIGLF